MTITGAGPKSLNARINNYGSAIWSDGAIQFGVLNGLAIIDNYGSFETNCSQLMSNASNLTGMTARIFLKFINEAGGAFSKTGAIGTTEIGIYFKNNGQVNLNGFSVDFSGGLDGNGTINP